MTSVTDIVSACSLKKSGMGMGYNPDTKNGKKMIFVHIKDNSHTNTMKSLPGLQSLCAAVRFSPGGGNWITGSSLG